MKKAIIPLIIVMCLSIGFSEITQIFNSNDDILFNPYFYAPTNTTIDRAYSMGWLHTRGGSGSGTFKLTPYGFGVFEGSHTDTGAYNGSNIEQIGNFPQGQKTIYINWSLTGTGSLGATYKMDVLFYNSTGNLVNSTNLITKATSTNNPSYFNQISTANIYLSSNCTKIIIKYYNPFTGVSYSTSASMFINDFRIKNTDTIGSDYYFTITQPVSSNQILSKPFINFQTKINKLGSSEVRGYTLSEDNFNNITGIITYDLSLKYTYFSAGYYYFEGSLFQEFKNASFILQNEFGNNLMITNLTTSYIPAPTNLSISISRTGSATASGINNYLTFYFKVPTRLISNSLLTYSIVMKYNNTGITGITFQDLGGKVSYKADNYFLSASKTTINGTQYYKLVFQYRSSEPIQVYEFLASYIESDLTDSDNYYWSNWASEQSILYVKSFKIYEYNGTIGKELKRTDVIESSDIYITPLSSGENPYWYMKHYDAFHKVNPLQVYTPLNPVIPLIYNLSYGENILTFQDNDGTIGDAYYITVKNNATLLNISIVNAENLEIDCYTNDTFTNCENLEINEPYELITYHNNYNYTYINVKVYCENDGIMKLYYSDVWNAILTDYSGFGNAQLNIPINPEFSTQRFSDLTQYLRENSGLIKLEDYEFNKKIMEWMSLQTQSNKALFLPAYTDCIIIEDFNNNSLNVSVRATNSLLTQIKQSAFIYELTSSCDIMKVKYNAIGIKYEEEDYLSYYWCVIKSSIASNWETIVNLGYLFLAFAIVFFARMMLKNGN